MKKCQYKDCTATGDPPDPWDVCNDVSPSGHWVCTRRKGHRGEHIACRVGDHCLAAWRAKHPDDKRRNR